MILQKAYRIFARILLRPIYLAYVRHKTAKCNVTIISQDCLGGFLYSRMGKQFLSPTINGFFSGPDFLKLCSDPTRYFSVDAVAYEESNESHRYPIISIYDIKMNCVHYATCQEAIGAWNRRRKRVNDRILVLGNSWRCNNDYEVFDQILACPYPKLMVTDNSAYEGNKECLVVDGSKKNADGVPEPLLIFYAPDACRLWIEKLMKIYDLVISADANQ